MTDKLLERKINNLQVHCINQNEGCGWTGDLQHAQEHLKKATNVAGTNTVRCEYEKTKCEKYGEELLYGKLDHHSKNTCKHRRIPCEFKFAGCEFECPEVSMPKHIEENPAKHLSLVTKHIRDNTRHVEGCTEHVRRHAEHIQDNSDHIQDNTEKIQTNWSKNLSLATTISTTWTFFSSSATFIFWYWSLA